MVDDTDAGTDGTAGNGEGGLEKEHSGLKMDTRRDATRIAALLARVLSRDDIAGDDAEDVRDALRLALDMDARTGRRDPTRRRRRASSST